MRLSDQIERIMEGKKNEVYFQPLRVLAGAIVVLVPETVQPRGILFTRVQHCSRCVDKIVYVTYRIKPPQNECNHNQSRFSSKTVVHKSTTTLQQTIKTSQKKKRLIRKQPTVRIEFGRLANTLQHITKKISAFTKRSIINISTTWVFSSAEWE